MVRIRLFSFQMEKKPICLTNLLPQPIVGHVQFSAIGWSAPGGVGRTPPEIHWILHDMVNKRAVRILLECILVPLWFLFSFWTHAE